MEETKTAVKETVKMTVCGGTREIELDISDKSCLRFGFKHGDRVMTHGDLVATIIGVAPGNNDDGNVLWYAIDRLKGRVCYYGNERTNLKKEGFRKLKKGEKIAVY